MIFSFGTVPIFVFALVRASGTEFSAADLKLNLDTPSLDDVSQSHSYHSPHKMTGQSTISAMSDVLVGALSEPSGATAGQLLSKVGAAAMEKLEESTKDLEYTNALGLPCKDINSRFCIKVTTTTTSTYPPGKLQLKREAKLKAENEQKLERLELQKQQILHNPFTDAPLQDTPGKQRTNADDNELRLKESNTTYRENKDGQRQKRYPNKTAERHSREELERQNIDNHRADSIGSVKWARQHRNTQKGSLSHSQAPLSGRNRRLNVSLNRKLQSPNYINRPIHSYGTQPNLQTQDANLYQAASVVQRLLQNNMLPVYLQNKPEVVSVAGRPEFYPTYQSSLPPATVQAPVYISRGPVQRAVDGLFSRNANYITTNVLQGQSIPMNDVRTYSAIQAAGMNKAFSELTEARVQNTQLRWEGLEKAHETTLNMAHNSNQFIRENARNRIQMNNHMNNAPDIPHNSMGNSNSQPFAQRNYVNPSYPSSPSQIYANENRNVNGQTKIASGNHNINQNVLEEPYNTEQAAEMAGSYSSPNQHIWESLGIESHLVDDSLP